MNAASIPARHATGIRRVRLAQDLKPIADLIEVCFDPYMDAGGRATVREMRALSRLGPLLHLMALADDMLKGIGAGFVWEDGGRIVGNVTLFPARIPIECGRVYVIANVAVDPAYRRQGIARRLMTTALDAIRLGGGTAAILQVESDNDGARHLYESLGFHVQRRWHEWRRGSQENAPPRLAVSPPIIVRPGSEWRAEYALAQQVFPEEKGGLGWQRPLHIREFRRSPGKQILDILSGTATERWIIRDEGTLAASLWAQVRFGGSVRLTLIVPPLHQGKLEEPLLNYGLRRLAAGYRPVMCEHPADDTDATAIFERYRFTHRRTLDYMRLDF